MPGLVHHSVGDAVDDLLAFAAENKPRFQTGTALDNYCGMIGPSELGLVLARSGSGKSTFLLNVITHTPEVSTCVFNLEMQPRRQILWLTCMSHYLPIPAKDAEDVLRAGPDHEHYATVVNALREMSTHYPHLEFISPDKAPSVATLTTAVKTLQELTGTAIQRVFIDHLTLMENARDYDGVQRTARELHEWALAEDIAVIAVQQTGRSGGAEGGRNDGHLPVTLSSGVFGGEDAADWIWGMYRKERDPKFHRLEDPTLPADKRDELQFQLEEVQGLVNLQLIKNRPYGELKERGLTLEYDPHTMKLSPTARGR